MQDDGQRSADAGFAGQRLAAVCPASHGMPLRRTARTFLSALARNASSSTAPAAHSNRSAAGMDIPVKACHAASCAIERRGRGGHGDLWSR